MGRTSKIQRWLLIFTFIGIITGLPACASEATTTAKAQATESVPPDISVIARSEGQGLFGVLSDIHFDPFYDPSLVDKLAASAPSDWDSIFATSSITAPSSAGNDTNYPLFSSALDSIARYEPLFDYLLVPGDLLSHDFQQNYDMYASDKSETAYKNFVIKTTQYITSSLKSRFPDIPIITTLGNNDSFCGDYMIEPAAGYLYDTATTMAGLTGNQVEFASYRELGVYLTPHPKTPRHYFVVLDNVFFSIKYNNSCGQSSPDPSQALLLWLKATLYRLQRENATATLILHVPSGINAYSSTNSCGGWGSPTPYLTSSVDQIFLSIIKQYSEQVTVIFTGHSHMDDYRVFEDDSGHPYAFQRIVPSISPIFDNNPSYQIYSYDRSNGSLVDAITLTYTGTTTNPNPWALTYDFMQEYQVGALTAKDVKNLAKKITTDEGIRASFIKNYTGGANSGTITDNNWPAFACAITNTDQQSFTDCYCSKSKESAKGLMIYPSRTPAYP